MLNTSRVSFRFNVYAFMSALLRLTDLGALESVDDPDVFIANNSIDGQLILSSVGCGCCCDLRHARVRGKHPPGRMTDVISD